jgi:hypothetical protein
VSVEPQANLSLIEETRKQINKLFDEVARLSESDLPPAEYHGELLKRVMQGLAGSAGAVWIRTEQGNLQLQHQINLREVGLDENGRAAHDELLRQACQKPRALHLPPHSSEGPQEGTALAPGNPTNFDVLLVPVMIDSQIVAGLIQVWQAPGRNPNAVQGFLQFLTRMAHLAALYMKNHKLRHIVGQQQVWTQLETFTKQVHGSLRPMEVAYIVANESRRLIDCDRVSVALRYARHPQIEAISGADIVEKRSNLVQLMRALAEEVMKWGEKLVYTGAQDDTLPPRVLHALDEFLAESNSKLLVVMPLRDERETKSTRPPRAAMLMECFEPILTAEQLMARMDVVARHATSALYNAVQYKRIPGRWIWVPLAAVQEGLGGKVRAIMGAVALGLAALIAMLVLVPYPLKMEAKGQLLPRERRWVYTPVEGRVMAFPPEIVPGATVTVGEPLVKMQDQHLQMQIIDLEKAIDTSKANIEAATAEYSKNISPQQKLEVSGRIAQEEATRRGKTRELNALRERTNSEPTTPGDFWLRSPIDGTVLNYGFREKFIGKEIKPSEQVLRVGHVNGTWEIELRIPQKHIGQVLSAFEKNHGRDLDVDLLLMSAPTHVYKGKLARNSIAGEANPNTEDTNESDPVVWASVRIEGRPGPDGQLDIPKADQLPEDMLVTGTEVHSRIRCGNRAMGYSLFYGLWEFFYEKVVFFF